MLLFFRMQDLKLSCEQIRMKNREAYRAEQYLPKVKWAAFQEQRRHEDFAAIRFEQKQASVAVKARSPDARVAAFCKRLRRTLDKRVRDVGGTEFSVLRTTFLDWDAACAGDLDARDFRHAMRALGLALSEEEARYVVGYYAVDERGMMRYDALVEDVARSGKHFMEHPEPRDARRELEETPRVPHRHPAILRRFIKKLRQKLLSSIKRNGEYERILIRRAFLNWDADASGQLDPKEFLGAMAQLGVTLTDGEARALVREYDATGSGGMVSDGARNRGASTSSGAY